MFSHPLCEHFSSELRTGKYVLHTAAAGLFRINSVSQVNFRFRAYDTRARLREGSVPVSAKAAVAPMLAFEAEPRKIPILR